MFTWPIYSVIYHICSNIIDLNNIHSRSWSVEHERPCTIWNMLSTHMFIITLHDVRKVMLREHILHALTRWIAMLWWGVLILTWYTYMCLPFGVLFTKFGIAISGFSSETEEPKFKNWVYLEQIIVKSTQFGQNWVLFYWKRYTNGPGGGSPILEATRM